jgi:hypothetical protein
MGPGKSLTVIFSIVVSWTVSAQQDSFPVLEGPYLGQTPPGMVAEVFAPGIITTEAIEASLTFSHDQRYLVFRRGFREDTEVFVSEQQAGVWGKPVQAPFFVKEYGFGDFTFSPNEPVLYFTSRRPLEPDQAPANSANLWKVEYSSDKWLTPTLISDVLVTPLHESYPSVSNDKTLFFFRRFDDENRNYEMMYSKFINGGYSAPVRMGSEINTQWEEWDPSIAPDGSFLIFCSKQPSGYGQDDLFVSFRTEGDGWSQAVNLGKGVNSEGSENRPFITSDMKYLFFNRGDGDGRDVYWVDLDAVRQLQP